MSIKQNFPTTKPTLNLDFANSKAVDSRITFTRASAATYTDAQGILQTLRDNKPRIDFDATTGECRGLLIEEQRTNLYTRSGHPHMWNDTFNGSFLPNAAIAPDGTMTALLITATNSDPFIYQTVSSLPGNVVVSVWVKATGAAIGKTGTIRISGYSVTTPAFTASWQRITASFNVTGSYIVGFEFPDSGAATGDQVYIWGPQVESGTFATSYIPSQTAFTSRASSATYFDSTGVMRTAPAGGARYGYGYDSATGKWVSQGLLLEPAATNTFVNANFLDGIGTSENLIFTKNATTAPDGTTTATKVVANTTNGYHRTTTSGPYNGAYTYSIFVKSAGSTYVRFQIWNTGEGVKGVGINLTNGTLLNIDNVLASGIINVGSGWYRVWFTTTVGNYSYTPSFIMPDVYADGGSTGDGTNGVYVWGCQTESGNSMSSYIPTFGASVTRSADVSSSAATTRAADSGSITGSAFKAFHNFNEYSIKFEMARLGQTGTDSTLWQIGNGSGNMQMYQYRNSGQINLYAATNNHNTNQSGFNSSGNVLVTSVFSKFAGAVALNNYASFAAGSLLGTDTSALVPQDVDTFYLGNMSGHYKNLTYYPKRLPDAQLQALTV